MMSKVEIPDRIKSVQTKYELTRGASFVQNYLTPARVEVWRWIFVRNAVKCGEKNNFHRVFLTSFCGECGESRWIIFFHRVLSILTKKNRPHTGSNLWPPACLQLLKVIWKLWKSYAVNFCKNAVNFAVGFCKKCGEMWWISFFSPHSPLSPLFLH